MAYVRARGRQVLIVHGERAPGSGKVAQRILFTIYSKAEAQEALDDLAGDHDGGRLGDLLSSAHPTLTFNWKRIARDVRKLRDVLPDDYDVRQERVRQNFRGGLYDFARQLMVADPQDLQTSAELIQEHRRELSFLSELIAWRTSQAKQETNESSADTRFYWRFERAARQVPLDMEEWAADLWEKRDLDRAETAFRVMVTCFDDYAEGHNYLGLIALEREHVADAVASFERTVELGRRLIPARMARRDWWSDHRTRPYMRGLGNLALALNRSGRWDEALAVCDRLEKECDGRITAMAHRSSVYLNTGRWAEAAGAARHLEHIDPDCGFLAALAHFETGRRREALAAFVHAALHSPRAARMLVATPTRRAPGSRQEVLDHNAGVETRRDLHAYLRDRRRPALRFFADVMERKSVVSLLAEMEQVVERRGTERGTREAFDRMTLMHGIEFARERAQALADELGLPGETPLLEPKPRGRGKASPAAPVH